MYAIVCVDNHMGTRFNGRRQSRDSALISYLEKIGAGCTLRMNSGSAALFPEDAGILVSDDFLKHARQGDLCFTEGADLTPFLYKLEGILLCRWNRDYPADRFLELDLSRFRLIHREEIPGTSHEKLTIEVYTL